MNQTENTEKRKRFAISRNRGFHITFDNGWTVSVQFGCCNYGDNYDDNDFEKERMGSGAVSDTAEVWAWKGDINNHFPAEPLGYQSVEDVWKFMSKVRRFKK